MMKKGKGQNVFLYHFVALADCIRSGYVGGQFVITRNILSFSFPHHKIIHIQSTKCGRIDATEIPLLSGVI